MAIAYLSLGTNLGDKTRNLNQAVQYISEQIGRIISLSAFYCTEPWGFSSENTFMNAACCIETTYQAQELLEKLKEIELLMGRKEKSMHGIYQDRVIDIDILFYDDLILKTDNLTIPHPYIADRMFVLLPLAEIAPTLKHPVMHKSIFELYQNLKNT